MQRLLEGDDDPDSAYVLDMLPRDIDWADNGALSIGKRPLLMRAVVMVAHRPHMVETRVARKQALSFAYLRPFDREEINHLLHYGGADVPLPEELTMVVNEGQRKEVHAQSLQCR